MSHTLLINHALLSTSSRFEFVTQKGKKFSNFHFLSTHHCSNIAPINSLPPLSLFRIGERPPIVNGKLHREGRSWNEKIQSCKCIKAQVETACGWKDGNREKWLHNIAKECRNEMGERVSPKLILQSHLSFLHIVLLSYSFLPFHSIIHFEYNCACVCVYVRY